MKKATAQYAACIYYEYIWRIYGSPESIMLDRGFQFIAVFFDELCSVIGVKQNLSIAEHPQTNSNTKIVNRYIQQRLRPFVSHYQDGWSDRLPVMDFA